DQARPAAARRRSAPPPEPVAAQRAAPAAAPGAGFPNPERSARRAADFDRFLPLSIYSCILAVQPGDVEQLRLLRLMPVFRPGENSEVPHDPAPERTARHHAFDCLLDDPLGMPTLENSALAAAFDAAGIAGVPIKDVVLALIAG